MADPGFLYRGFKGGGGGGGGVDLLILPDYLSFIPDFSEIFSMRMEYFCLKGGIK